MHLTIIEGGRGFDIPAYPDFGIQPALWRPGVGRTGTLFCSAIDEVSRVLGMAPNGPPHEIEWYFTMDGAYCSVWSHKDSHRMGTWSTHGQGDVFRKLFGSKWIG